MRPIEEIQVVRPGVFFWQGYDPSVKTDLSCCALAVSGSLILIDPLLLTPAALQELAEQGSPAGIILTNGNHARAADFYRSRFDIPVYAHPAAIPELGIEVDREVVEGAVLRDSLQVVELTGAGSGEIALHHGAAGGGLVLGDALIHLEKAGFALLPEKYCQDPAELRRSMGKLLQFPVEILMFAHGLPIVAQARQRLEDLIRSL